MPKQKGIRLGRNPEYFQERDFTKHTYHTAMKMSKLRGIPLLSLVLVVEVFDHKRTCKKQRGCGVCAENREWVMTDDPTYVFSFVSCVERIGADVAWVRGHYLKPKEEHSHGISQRGSDV